MDFTKVKFGDKIFLYGQYLQLIEEFEDYEYNAVMGFTTVGGYEAHAIESYEPDQCVTGFVAEIGQLSQFTVATPFLQMEMVDVTEYLARRLPLPSGTKIWLPTTQGPEVYSHLR